MNENLKYSFFLMTVSFLWGAAYPIMKIALGDANISPALVMTVRFLTAFFFLAVFFFRGFVRNFHKDIIRPVFWVSLILFGDYFLYTVGLKYTTSINSGFYTGLAVVFVPFLALLFKEDKWQAKNLIPIAVTFLGIYFLSSNGGTVTFNTGDILCLGGGLLFGLYIVLSGKFFRGLDPLSVSVLQMAFVGAMSLALTFFLDGAPRLLSFDENTWVALVILGVFCTAAPFFLQHYAQGFFTPLLAAVIYSLMPLFTAVLSFILLDERLSWRGILGGALIIAAIILARLGSRADPARKTET